MTRTENWALSALSTVLLLGVAACGTLRSAAPVGFAAYDANDPFRAVSPDGVVFRVRSEGNEPEARLPFWKEALKKRMIDAGYVFVTDGEVKAAHETGYLLELAAPLGQQDYSYLLAVFDRGANLVIVEASGEVTKFRPRREAVVAAIGKLEL